MNDALVDAPELVNQDPYGAGWILEVELADPAELDALLDADAYRGARSARTDRHRRPSRDRNSQRSGRDRAAVVGHLRPRYPNCVVCARCGHANQPEARFCSSCGASLEAAGRRDHADAPGGRGRRRRGRARRAISRGCRPASGCSSCATARAPDRRSASTRDHTNVGRHPDSEIFLDDITVSRRHVVLDRTPTGYVLRDVGSLNGTYVNRERADEATLRHGDELQIGRYRLSFVLGGRRPGGLTMPTSAQVSIGDVLDQLRPEFADITISKIRFLESQGLIDPGAHAVGIPQVLTRPTSSACASSSASSASTSCRSR